MCSVGLASWREEDGYFIRGLARNERDGIDCTLCIDEKLLRRGAAMNDEFTERYSMRVLFSAPSDLDLTLSAIKKFHTDSLIQSYMTSIESDIITFATCTLRRRHCIILT